MIGGSRMLGHRLAPGTVKICGVREPSQARAAAAAGADLVGFIFAPARRRVTPEAARLCIEEARAAAGRPGVMAVGVFVDVGAEEINRTVEVAGLDLVQLHGDEPPGLLGELSRPVVKAVRPEAGTPLSEVVELIERYRAVPNAPLTFLVDGYAAGIAGGEGVRADWGLAATLARSYPVVLAGGLTAESVGRAINEVRPIGVDVSSGVERAGEKVARLIGDFVAAAKTGFGGP